MATLEWIRWAATCNGYTLTDSQLKSIAASFGSYTAQGMDFGSAFLQCLPLLPELDHAQAKERVMQAWRNGGKFEG